jgi:hypothetical protein
MKKTFFSTAIILSILCLTASAQESSQNGTFPSGVKHGRPYTADLSPLTPDKVAQHKVNGLGFKMFTTANGTVFYVTPEGKVEARLTTTTTSTTIRAMKDLCGGTDLYCSVEYDMNNNGKNDCCSVKDNPVCAGCLEECKTLCAKNYEGVKTCFMDRGASKCDCTRNLPTCYQIDLSNAPAEVREQGQSGGMSTGWYVLMFFLLIVGMSLAAKFANRIL